MNIVEESDNRLILSSSPGGSGLSVFTALGTVGCALPFLLIGLLFAIREARVFFSGGGFEVFSVLVPLMMFALGGAFLSFFLHTKKTGSQRHQQTFERGNFVLQETFAPSGSLLEKRKTELNDQSRLLGRHRVARVPSQRGSTNFDFYDSLIVTPGAEEAKLDSSTQPQDCLHFLLRLRRVLELPMEIDFLPLNFRPDPEEAGKSKEAQSYRQSADKRELTVDLGGGVQRASLPAWLIVGFFGMLSAVCFAILSQGSDGATLAMGIIFGSLALMGLIAVVADMSSSAKVEIAQGRIVWYEGSKVVSNLPLEELHELAIMGEGLHFIFPSQTRSLLTGTEGREERVYLYHLVDTTCQAHGLPPFAGAFGQRLGV